MPRLLIARPAADAVEERAIRKLAGARHAPADWILRARVVALSWDGFRVPAIAAELGCHEQTVRRWLHRFTTDGLQGLGDRPVPGRPRRITEDERSRIIALVKQDPPGRPVRQADGELQARDETGTAVWTLDSLAQAARAQGISIGRSQVRMILLAEGVRWRRTRSWIRSKDPDFAGKGRGSSPSTPTRRRAPRSSAPTSWGR
ncbi:helix-turn-helix domain-containing protein [Pseudonocardia sp. H11422]|uniref:helix-turn-helix domain-containing protein n=1 Tax=Pseudonocardia sp. H11422 TaxID=2835866 RepID=UPI001BDD7C42|nr:helix-turn-helix domain-containing protein [Pseudonocardia sp. H11422]